MKVKIKKLNPNAKMPKRGTKHAAGFDLYAAEEFDALIHEEQTVRIQTGLAFEMREWRDYLSKQVVVHRFRPWDNPEDEE